MRIVYVVILSFVFVSLHGCETWSPHLREEHRLRLLENSVLRRTFGPKREEVTGWYRLYKEELYDGRGMWHVSGRGEVHTGFWLGNLGQRDHLEELRVDGRTI